MISIRARRKARARKNQFVPTGLGGPDCIQLEGRALTAPLFWRNHDDWVENALPGENISWTIAQAQGNFSPPGSIVLHEADNNAQAGSTSSNTSANGRTTAVVTGSGSASASDIAQTPPPGAPVGASTVALNATATISISTNGPDPVFNPYNANGAAVRTYFLADTSATGSPTAINEYFTFNYTPGAQSVTQVLGGCGAANTVGLSVGVAGDNTGLTLVAIDGTPMTIPSSGSFVDGRGNAITYSVSTTSVVVNSTRALGTLPQVQVNAGNWITSGIRWPADATAALATQPGIVGGGISVATAHYDAYFS